MIQSALLADFTTFCICAVLRIVVEDDEPPPPQPDTASAKLSDAHFRYVFFLESINANFNFKVQRKLILILFSKYF